MELEQAHCTSEVKVVTRRNIANRLCRAFGPVLPVLLAVLAGCTPSPHDLIARGQNDALGRALEKDAAGVIVSRDRKGKTPLHAAVSCENGAAMEMLVAHGADPNASDITGMTPLHVAAMLGRSTEAEWLLGHGARLDARDSFGDTPVHTAAVFGQGGVIQVLAGHGAVLDAPNSAGKTPLVLARDNRQERVVALLQSLPAAAAPPAREGS